MDDGRPSDADVRWTAQRTIRMHQHEPLVSWQTGRCAHCRDDGCDMLAWAESVMAAASSLVMAGVPAEVVQRHRLRATAGGREPILPRGR